MVARRSHGEEGTVGLAGPEPVDGIEAGLRSRDGLEVQSSALGDMVVERLKLVDQVAYIRFASVYRQFADISSFEDELRKLLKN